MADKEMLSFDPVEILELKDKEVINCLIQRANLIILGDRRYNSSSISRAQQEISPGFLRFRTCLY